MRIYIVAGFIAFLFATLVVAGDNDCVGFLEVCCIASNCVPCCAGSCVGVLGNGVSTSMIIIPFYCRSRRCEALFWRLNRYTVWWFLIILSAISKLTSTPSLSDSLLKHQWYNTWTAVHRGSMRRVLVFVVRFFIVSWTIHYRYPYCPPQLYTYTVTPFLTPTWPILLLQLLTFLTFWFLSIC